VDGILLDEMYGFVRHFNITIQDLCTKRFPCKWWPSV